MRNDKHQYGAEFGEALERFTQWAERFKIDAESAFGLAYRLFESDHFGEEWVACADRSMRYLNTGDTYNATLVIEGDDLIVTTWGDWVELAERQHCIDNDLIRCGYCAEFTDKDKEQWSDVTCSHCGHNVQTGEL